MMLSAMFDRVGHGGARARVWSRTQARLVREHAATHAREHDVAKRRSHDLVETPGLGKDLSENDRKLIDVDSDHGKAQQQVGKCHQGHQGLGD